MKKAARSHFVSSVLGGLIVAAGLVALGVTRSPNTQTIVQEAPVVAETSPAGDPGLTPHDIYQREAPAVVFVRAKLVEPEQSPFDTFQQPLSGTSTGSGFLVDRLGDIVTNYHVIDGAERSGGVTVQFEGETLRAATVVAIDRNQDIAILRVDLAGVPEVRPLPLGDSTTVRVGDPTLAIGNPAGLDRTLTSGIVAALQHEIEAADGSTVDNVIQTEQPLEPGISGGPLLDADGRVIGIDSQVNGAGGAAIPFATPINTVEPLLRRVQRGTRLELAYLGCTGVAVRGAHPAITITSVARDSPAAAAGLRRGDAIEKLDGDTISSMADVQALVATHSPGQLLPIEIRRAGRIHTLVVRLGALPAPGD